MEWGVCPGLAGHGCEACTCPGTWILSPQQASRAEPWDSLFTNPSGRKSRALVPLDADRLAFTKSLWHLVVSNGATCRCDPGSSGSRGQSLCLGCGLAGEGWGTHGYKWPGGGEAETGAFLTRHWWGPLSQAREPRSGAGSPLALAAVRPSRHPGCRESGSSGGSSDVPPPPCSLQPRPLVSQTPAGGCPSWTGGRGQGRQVATVRCHKCH